MTYRKSKSGSEFCRVKEDDSILGIMFFPNDSCRIQVTRNGYISEDVKRGDLFNDCTQREFEEAHARAKKLTEL